MAHAVDEDVDGGLRLLLIGLGPLLLPWLGPDLYLGFLYLCTLPATVQSAIAFTSIAHGNVAAAVCSAAASSLLGVFLTPLLAGLLLGRWSRGPRPGTPRRRRA